MKKENKRLHFAQKIGMTILLLLLIRFMSHIPVPGVKHSMFKLAVAGKGNGYFQLYDRLTGGSFSNMTIIFKDNKTLDEWFGCILWNHIKEENLIIH